MNDDILDDYKERPKLDFAGFGLRLGAYLVDIVPIVIILTCVVYYVYGIIPYGPSGRMVEIDGVMMNEAAIAKSIIRYASFLLWIIYCCIMEASSFQGTFGKVFLDIKVTDETGNQLTFTKSLIRNATKILSYIIIALGFIWVLFDKERRGWHDMIAKTYVIKKESVY